MRGPRLCLSLLAGGLLLSVARADDAPRPASLERTDAFDRAYAASYYQFDACGDELTGRLYRKALVERFAQCPFSAAARARFRTRSAAQRQQSAEEMEKLIEDNSGLPVRLDGMKRTCREQRDSREYLTVLSRLADFSAGKSGPEAVVAEPCEAAEITP
jgi:hypothetical protein